MQIYALGPSGPCRVEAFGWPRERITVIDDDLGKSGASSVERRGLQRLIAEIGLGNAGLVLSLDASSLARLNLAE